MSQSRSPPPARFHEPVSLLISGGQTGADRGGLDAAADLGLRRGGWAPRGWRAEDGVIPLAYRADLRESYSSAYPVRTRQNVEGSDATLIVSLGDLTDESGSMLTARLARGLGKPCRHVLLPGDRAIYGIALERAVAWLRNARPRVLNVAGPRESKEPGLQTATRRSVVAILRACRGDE